MARTAGTHYNLRTQAFGARLTMSESTQETSRAIADALARLSEQTKSVEDLTLLRYLLDMARDEAETLARRPEPAKPGVRVD